MDFSFPSFPNVFNGFWKAVPEPEKTFSLTEFLQEDSTKVAIAAFLVFSTGAYFIYKKFNPSLSLEKLANEQVINQLSVFVKNEKISPEKAIRMVESLLKYDTQAAIDIAKKLPKESKVQALLVIGQSLASKEPQKAKELYEYVYRELNNLDEVVLEKEKYVLLLGILANSFALCDETRTGEIFKEALKEADKTIQSKKALLPYQKPEAIKTVLQGIRRLNQDDLGKLSRKQLTMASISGLKTARAQARMVDKEQLLQPPAPPGVTPFPSGLVELARTNYTEVMRLIDKEIKENNRRVPCAKVLVAIAKENFTENAPTANIIFKLAEDLANVNSLKPQIFPIIGKALASLGQGQEADRLFAEAEKAVSKGNDQDYFFFAKKIRNHNPYKASKIFEKVLGQLSVTPSLGEAYHFSILDKAPSSFWKGRAQKIHNLSKSLDGGFQLLYSLKILDHCENDKVKTTFAQKLKGFAAAF